MAIKNLNSYYNMGCCFSKSKELQELEDELGMLVAEKRRLEALIEEKITGEKTLAETEHSFSIMLDIDRIIDKEQYATSKVLDYLHNFSGFEAEKIKVYTQRIIEISSLNGDEKIKKYADLRYEESEIERKMCTKVGEAHSKFVQSVNNKYREVDERIEALHRALKNGDYYSEKLRGIVGKFSSIPSDIKNDFESLVSKNELLDDIDKDIVEIEKSLPTFNKDIAIITNLKELSRILADVTKISLTFVKSLERKLGSSNQLERIDQNSLKPVEINLESYISVSESIISSLKNLEELETLKETILTSNKIEEELEQIDKELTMHFHDSNKHKDEALSRLNRVSRSASGNSSSMLLGLVKLALTSDHSLHKAAYLLKEKTIKLFKSSSEQDKNLLEMTEKFSRLEENLDEIELRIEEIVSSDIKDLLKSIPAGDKVNKSRLDEIQGKLAETRDRSDSDLLEHFTSLLKSIEIGQKIGNIRDSVRESQSKEIMKIRTDLQDKINELNSAISLLENDKRSLENVNSSLKASSEKTSEVAERMISSCKEKELEVSQLRNSLASLQEQYDQLNQEYGRVQDDIENLTKENRECKKNLRTKEHEIATLKESMEKEN